MTREPWSAPRTPFTLEHVSPLGVTPRRLSSALDAGVIVRLRQGVYVATDAVPRDPVALHLLRALAEQACSPAGVVASHETAALALGLPLARTERAAEGAIHLTRQRSARGRSRVTVGRRIHLGDLPSHHLTTLPSGLVVTTAARTAADLAGTAPLPEGLMVLDAACRLEFASLAGSTDRRHYANDRLRRLAVLPVAEAAGRLQAPGARRRVEGMLALADVRRESSLESFSAGHMYLAGLPAPRLQVPVRTAGGVFHPDCLWEAERVIGEADGEGKYADPRAFSQEKVREQHLRDDGWAVVRWTGHEMSATPGSVLDRIGRALVAGGWDGVARARWDGWPELPAA